MTQLGGCCNWLYSSDGCEFPICLQSSTWFWSYQGNALTTMDFTKDKMLQNQSSISKLVVMVKLSLMHLSNVELLIACATPHITGKCRIFMLKCIWFEHQNILYYINAENISKCYFHACVMPCWYYLVLGIRECCYWNYWRR